MNHRLICTVLAAALVFMGGLQVANATTWDARTDWSSVNDAGSAWQCMYMTTVSGANGPYIQMPTEDGLAWRYDAGWTTYFATSASAYPDIRSDWSASGPTGVLAWTSPVAGFVDLTYQVRAQLGGAPEGTTAAYRLYKDTAESPFVSGSISTAGAGDTTGLVTVPNLPVVVGTKFYLQTDYGPELNGDTLGVTFTLTEVPEPGTLALLGSALVGLLVCAWRKRK